MGLLISPWRLKRFGILAMNRRNSDYVQGHNPRELYPLVDNKLRTKEVAANAGIPVPELYGAIEHNYELRSLGETLAPYDEFVIKPAKGSGGSGIQVVTGRDGPLFIKGSGKRISLEFLKRHVANILSGLCSLGGQRDYAMIEYRVRPTPALGRISHQGVPDIRIILFHGYPVMAMLRLATHYSDGKANLHQGAVGVGINILDGSALSGVWRNRTVSAHPDSGLPLHEIRISNWHDLLLMAARCYDATGLGYLGVDLVIDNDRGPLVLEMNARPGLAIQIANNAGLLPRLGAIGKQYRKERLAAAERVEWMLRWLEGQSLREKISCRRHH